MFRPWYRASLTPSTWHVVHALPDGRRTVFAVRRSKREAVATMERAAQRLAADGLSRRPVGSAIALHDGYALRAALEVEPCTIERCPACAALPGHRW